MLDGSYRDAVRRVGDQHFVVLHNVSALRHREQGLVLSLAASVVLVTAVSAVTGRWLATRAITPVTSLVRGAAELHPEDSGRTQHQRRDL